MKINFILTIFSAVILLSCGKSKDEKMIEDAWEAGWEEVSPAITNEIMENSKEIMEDSQ